MALAAEVTSVTCVAKSAIDSSEYFLLYGMGSDFEENAYHVWINNAGGGGEPSLSSTGIEVTVGGTYDATTVASAVVGAVVSWKDIPVAPFPHV